MRCNLLEENLVLFIDSVRVFCKHVDYINIINVIIGNNGRYSNKNANVLKIKNFWQSIRGSCFVKLLLAISSR